MHTLVARAGAKWAVFFREHETGTWSTQHLGHVLRPIVEASFAHGFAHPWTFSERQGPEVMADVAEEPEQLAGVGPAVSLEILAPERRFPTDDRWAAVYKLAGRTDLRSLGPASAFMGFRQGAPYEMVLKDSILNGFLGFDKGDKDIGVDNHWRTFTQTGASRPPYLRELYVRSTWNARLLCPDSFPEFRPGPVVSDEQAARRIARMPQHKSAARRAQHQANAERFRAEAAERARLRGEVA